MRHGRLLPFILLAPLAAACGDDDSLPEDGGVVADAAVDGGQAAEDAAVDGGLAAEDAAVDGGQAADASAENDAGSGTTSSGSLTYRGNTVQLDRMLFGLDRIDDGDGLYFELYRGGRDECPSETSETPDQVITLSGFAGREPATRTFADGVRANFFDFEGLLRDEIVPAMATDATVEVLTISAEEATVTFDITFDEGTAMGTFVALHCDSLDTE